jgi:hypothetical protein
MKTENDGAGAKCQPVNPNDPPEKWPQWARSNDPHGEAKIRMGFHVEIKMHTKDAEKRIVSPEWLRNRIGEILDKRKLQEEIDYTLEVKRTYEQV